MTEKQPIRDTSFKAYIKKEAKSHTNKDISFNTDSKEAAKEIINAKKDMQKDVKAEEELTRDTSFKTYIKVKKERSTLSRVIILLIKVALGLILLPSIIFVGGIFVGALAMVLGTTLALIVGGFALLIGGTFFASSLGGNIIAFVIAVAITCLSLGFLILILILESIKAGIKVCKTYSKRIRNNRAEVETSQS